MNEPNFEPAWHSAMRRDGERLGASSLFRRTRVVDPVDATHVRVDGVTLVNFCSNNYLGLTHHPDIRAAAGSAIEQWGFGGAAAPLICGYGPAHASAERAIALWKGTESALLLPSGYQANLAAIQAAAAIGRLGAGVRFLVDKLAHASLIDAVRGSGESFRVFPHNQVVKLERLLADAPQGELQVVVTESIFSMDGDAAPLAELAPLKKRYDFLLILDEAHATGVYGPAGSGLANELNLRDIVDVSTITLSKALGGIGGAICGSSLFRDAAVNYGRAFLFSTAVPSAVAAAAEAAIAILRIEPHRQARLRMLARHVREELRKCFEIAEADSPIIPIILGSEDAAIHAAKALADEGLLVMPIRPPTVPKGSSRLRVTLCSQHDDEVISRLIGALYKLSKSR